MPHRAIIYLIPYLASAAVTAWLSVLAWRRKSVPGARFFAGLACSEVVWTLGYMLQLVAPSLNGKIFWNNVQFVGAVAAPLAYLGFALEYDRTSFKTGWFTWKPLAPVALLLLGFIWTDGLHGLFRRQAHLQPGTPFSILLFTDGPGFPIYTIYAYSLILLTTLVLISRYLHASSLYRVQIGIVFIGVLVPWVTTIFTALGWVPVRLHEATPITFGVSNLIIAWALFRYHLFEYVPVARDFLIENMQEGVFVLDSRLRIVDLNPAARQVLGMRDSVAIGKRIDECLPLDAAGLQILTTGASEKFEIALQDRESPGFYEIQSSRLKHPWDLNPIYLIILRDIRHRKEIEGKLHRLAVTDALTGIFNRRHIMALAQQELERAQRLRRDLAIVIFDIDHFKRINDHFGHLAGDQVLEILARECQANLRSFDILGRYGGEEFLIVLPETGASTACTVSERLRCLVEGLKIPHERGLVQVSISLGIACLSPGRQMDLDQLIEEADQALYHAKATGRNRISHSWVSTPR
jgi:diguanylate cyclase (GGDEF)-like protein/PAS domain S-box-containing protein